MAAILTTALLCIAVAMAGMKIFKWKSNYRAAKKTGFATFYSPVHLTDVWWIMLYKFLVPVLELLPSHLKDPWLPMAQIHDIWKIGHKPFTQAHSDNLMLATPKGNMLWTCDPSVVNQVLNQHDKAQVAVDLVKFYDIWGPTVGSVEGEAWKIHRRLITSAFTKSTDAAVWKEAMLQVQSLGDFWIKQGSVVPIVKEYTSRLALHVISAVFFHKTMVWGNEDRESVKTIEEGHRMTFYKALFTVVARLGIIFVTPRALLGKIPLKSFKESHLAFNEWTKYMQELQGKTVAHMEEIVAKKNKSILESIVVAGIPGSNQPEHRSVPEESILGNIFFTLLAGHETTGNTLAFTLLLLAIHPHCQKQLQAELDAQFGQRSREDWSIEEDYPSLQKGYTGAVLKEVLRLYCVVQFILRQIVAPITLIDAKGTPHTVPENTTCLIDFAAAFRNTKNWPERELSAGQWNAVHQSPAIFFDPSRWLDANRSDSGDEIEERSVPKHWPFGQGPRSCPGRQFAQVEMTSVLATLFKDYSLELVVDGKTLHACNGDSKLAWESTRDHALKMLIDDVKCNINIYLLKELPIRVLRREA